MLADRFTQVFREEHRSVRDTLLDLIRAFEDRDKRRISLLLHQTARLTGPHFRYEEEALYPGLTELFGFDNFGIDARLLRGQEWAAGVEC